MRLIYRLFTTLALIFCVVVCTGVVADKIKLQNELIRLHVVANSDSEKDQAVKLKVKDAIVDFLQPAMEEIKDKEEADRFIRENLPKIQQIANEVLKNLGEKVTASVSLTREEFDIRDYDTFSLPSGVYDALRIQIGEGEGKNWWCVAFPTLCLPATDDEFSDVAVSAGFSDGLTQTLTRKDGYQIRFYFLDLLGKVEKMFH